MPNHDIDPFPCRTRRALRGIAAAAAVSAFAVLTPGAALASGGTAAPSGDQQPSSAGQTSAQQTNYPSGGAAAQPVKHKKKKKTHKASHHVKLPAELKKIAMCESGGNPRAISPSGRYRGKYQFDMETWRSVGGKGDPAKAPEWYQDKKALRLYHERGTAPWPNCA